MYVLLRTAAKTDFGYAIRHVAFHKWSIGFEIDSVNYHRQMKM